jgi:SAM-dependent methyltransferase
MNGQSPTQFTALAAHYDELMEVVPYEGWAEYVMTLCEVVGHKPKKVLDCACGTGNVTFALNRYNLNLTGVDIATDMIRVARQKAEAYNIPIRFIEADLTKFELGETFDTATCLYDSFNYILEPAMLQAAFIQIGKHIQTDGWFIFDMNSEYALTADLFTQFNRDPRKKLHYDWRAQYDPVSRITSVDMLFERHEPDGTITKFTETHRERAYPLADIHNMLDNAGWELDRVYDAYTLNRPHDQSERWFFVARKL